MIIVICSKQPFLYNHMTRAIAGYFVSKVEILLNVKFLDKIRATAMAMHKNH